MTGPRITEKNLAEFKFNETDENQTITRLVRRLLPENENLILDIGAGLGDIATEAFPDRETILIDIADFSRAPCSLHQRVTQDFFDYCHDKLKPTTMLFSHVLQYIDEDIDRLNAKVSEIDPEFIIVVCDITDAMQNRIFDWFRKQNIPFNPEVPIPSFPGNNYLKEASIEFDGEIRTENFALLAERLGSLIFDASISKMQSRSFGRWLSEQLPEPKFIIPQSIELFHRKDKEKFK